MAVSGQMCLTCQSWRSGTPALYLGPTGKRYLQLCWCQVFMFLIGWPRSDIRMGGKKTATVHFIATLRSFLFSVFIWRTLSLHSVLLFLLWLPLVAIKPYPLHLFWPILHLGQQELGRISRRSPWYHRTLVAAWLPGSEENTWVLLKLMFVQFVIVAVWHSCLQPHRKETQSSLCALVADPERLHRARNYGMLPCLGQGKKMKQLPKWIPWARCDIESSLSQGGFSGFTYQAPWTPLKPPWVRQWIYNEPYLYFFMAYAC